jgi:hypothetical protein
MMRNLARRLDHIEKAAIALKRKRKDIAWWALLQLKRDQGDSLLSSIRAEREGRPLNAAESAARQAYNQAVEDQCRFSGLSSNGLFKPNPNHLTTEDF